jgi:hypothetical protein
MSMSAAATAGMGYESLRKALLNEVTDKPITENILPNSQDAIPTIIDMAGIGSLGAGNNVKGFIEPAGEKALAYMSNTPADVLKIYKSNPEAIKSLTRRDILNQGKELADVIKSASKNNIDFWSKKIGQVKSTGKEVDISELRNVLNDEIKSIEKGIVVRKEGSNIECFKLKSFRFLEYETKQLDSGEIDIETSQSEINEPEINNN